MSTSNKIISVVASLAVVFSVVLASPAQAATNAELQAQIATLTAQLTANGGTSMMSAASGYVFTKTLKVGSKGADVWNLQKVLNSSADTQVALTGAGSPGMETSTFGPATKAAVIKFQNKYASDILAPVGLTKGTGTVGASTRAKLNELTSTVVTVPVTPVTPTNPNNGNVPPVTTTGGAITVTQGVSPAGNFPAGASQVPVLVLNFTAGNTPVTVTGINVYRGGLSSDNDINNVYLKDGATVVASNLGIGSGKITFSQSNGLFIVGANSTKTITVAADIGVGSASSVSSHTYSFSVNSISDVQATGSVGGTFPVMGSSLQAVTVNNPALATLAVDKVSTGTSVNAGTTQFLAGQFTIQAQNSPVSLKSIKFTEIGSINSATDLANIKLMNGAQQVGATVPNLNPDGSLVFDLASNPLVIPAGQTNNLSLYVDVTGGVGRYFQFTIQRTYDISGTDQTYNVGAAVSATGSSSSFPINGSNGAQITVQQGTLTIKKSASSPSGYIAAGSTNQIIGAFDVQATGEAVRVTGLTYLLKWTGSAAENTVFNNLKLVDDQGVQLGTTYTSGNTSAAQSQNAALSNLNYIVPANTTRILYVKADIQSGTTATGFNAALSGVATQGYTSLASNTYAGPFTSSFLNTSSTPFGVAQSSGLGTVSTVAGVANVRVASFAMTAGPAEGVNVTTIGLTTNSGVSTKFNNLTVKINGAQVGQVQPSLTDSHAYTFSPSSPIMVPLGGSVTVDVYADPIVGTTYSSAQVVQLTSVSATGAQTNTLEPSTYSVNGQNVVVTAGGTLTSSAASTIVPSQYVGMGVTGVKVASFKLAADNNEPLNVTQLVLKDVTNQSGKELSNIRLMSGTTQIGSVQTAGAVSGGISTTTINLQTGQLVVPQNSNVQVDVIADVNTSNNGAVSGATHVLSLAPVSYQGASGNVVMTNNVVSSGTTITVYETNLNVVAGSSFNAPSIGDSALVGQFNVTASTGFDAIINSLVIKNAGGLVQSSSTITVKLYDAANPSVLLGSAALSGSATSSITLNSSAGWSIGAGQTKTLLVKADLASATNLTPASSSSPSGSRSYQVQIIGAAWNDGDTTGIALDPSIVLPIVGQTSNL